MDGEPVARRVVELDHPRVGAVTARPGIRWASRIAWVVHCSVKPRSKAVSLSAQRWGSQGGSPEPTRMCPPPSGRE